MKILMVSKALVSAEYRKKLAELARLGAEMTAVVPHEWREAGRQRYEPADDRSYRVLITRVRFNGRFHLHYYPALPDIVRALRPDLVHIDEEPYNLATYLGVRAASRAGVPGVFFTWQNIRRAYPPPFRQTESHVYRSAAAALAGSRDAERVLSAKGFRKPVWVVPQFGVDPDVFSPGESPSGPFSVGFFNRLVAAKGPLLVLAAMRSLPEDSRLLMVGDGPLRGEVEREIIRLGLSGRVSVIPRVPSTQMPALVRSVHVSVLPSLTTSTWKEQFGRVLIEAMASEVPVVGSSSGQIPEVVGDSGLIVPEGDAEALSAALMRLYEDSALRSELGRRGRRRVLERFTQARVAEHTMSAYTALLEVTST